MFTRLYASFKLAEQETSQEKGTYHCDKYWKKNKLFAVVFFFPLAQEKGRVLIESVVINNPVSYRVSRILAF